MDVASKVKTKLCRAVRHFTRSVSGELVTTSPPRRSTHEAEIRKAPRVISPEVDRLAATIRASVDTIPQVAAKKRRRKHA